MNRLPMTNVRGAQTERRRENEIPIAGVRVDVGAAAGMREAAAGVTARGGADHAAMHAGAIDPIEAHATERGQATVRGEGLAGETRPGQAAIVQVLRLGVENEEVNRLRAR